MPLFKERLIVAIKKIILIKRNYCNANHRICVSIKNINTDAEANEPHKSKRNELNYNLLGTDKKLLPRHFYAARNKQKIQTYKRELDVGVV